MTMLVPLVLLSWVVGGEDGSFQQYLNSSPSGQNGRYFADNIFSYIFVNEKFCILIKISLHLVPKGPMDNIPALVQIMAWHRIGDKPLSEPMLTRFTDAYMRHKGEMSKSSNHWLLWDGTIIFEYVVFKPFLMFDFVNIAIGPLMTPDLLNNQTLVLIAWHRNSTSHYLNQQCWQVPWYYVASPTDSRFTPCGLLMPYGLIDLCLHWFR